MTAAALRYGAARRPSVSFALGTAGLAALIAVASPAAAQDRFNLDVTAGAGLATNPFLEAGDTPTAVSGTLAVHPSWLRERPLTTIRFEADADVTFYTRRYGTNESFNVQSSVTHRLSSATSINGGLGYINTIVGSYNGLNGFGNFTTPVVDAVARTGGTGVTAPVQTPILPPVANPSLPVFVIDPTLAGIGRRRQAYLASAGITTMLSPRSRAELSVAASINRSGGAAFADFSYIAPTASYTRAISKGFTVGARVTVGLTDYRGTSIGDATIYQPALTVSRALSERWTLSGAIGLAIVDLNGMGGTSVTSTNVNGNASLCRRDTRWNACLNASRQTLPSAFQGVRSQTSVDASLGYRVNARDDFALSAGYSRADAPIQRIVPGVFDGAVEFVSVSGTYSHRFARVIRGFITAGYAKAIDDFVKRDANATILAGVTYSFGKQP